MPLYWWKPGQNSVNFGDEISPIIVEKISGKQVRRTFSPNKKLLALGSMLHVASEGDIIWGTGCNKNATNDSYHFKMLDVRAVRGPLTREFLLERHIPCPKIYGDPALLLPILFPELKATYEKEYILIPHLSEYEQYKTFKNLILPTQEPMKVISEILKAKFVISGSLHGVIVAEAFGIPARMLRLTENEHLAKYQDYYLGTGRPNFRYAKSVKEAFELGGESPVICDLEKLLEAFPHDLVF